MNDDRAQSALRVLHWVIALVIVAEGAVFAFSSDSAHVFAKTGLPGSCGSRWPGQRLERPFFSWCHAR